MHHSKLGIAASLLLVFVFMLGACAQATPPPAEIVEVTREVETIVEATVVVKEEVVVTQEVEVPVAVQSILYNSYNGDPEPRAFDEKIVADWNAAHPEMPVNHSIIAHEDFKQAIRAYLTADPAPDVLTWFAGNRTRFFIDKGLVYDLSKMWADNKFNEVYAPGFQELASYNDKQYFLPTAFYWWAIYYRPSLFESAGIEKPPETWDELLDSCSKLNAIGVTPFTIGARFKWPAAAWFDYLNMRINGPQFHIDLMDLKIPYNDPRVAAVFEKWAEMINAGCFIEDPAAYDWQEAIPLMTDGKAAMYLMGQFIVDSYPDELENDLDFFRFPIIDPNQPIGEDAPTDGFFVSANAGNPAGAEAFMAYLGSKEVQQQAFETLGRLPTRTDVDVSGALPPTQKGIALIQGADMIAQFYDRDTTPPMAEAGMEAFMRFWDDPTQIEALLNELENERQRILAEEAP